MIIALIVAALLAAVLVWAFADSLFGGSRARLAQELARRELAFRQLEADAAAHEARTLDHALDALDEARQRLRERENE